MALADPTAEMTADSKADCLAVQMAGSLAQKMAGSSVQKMAGSSVQTKADCFQMVDSSAQKLELELGVALADLWAV